MSKELSASSGTATSRSMIRDLLALGISAVLLSSCANTFNPDTAGSTHSLGPWHRIYEADLDVAFASDSAPPIIGARQRQNPQREQIQEAILRNDTNVYGENKIIVAVRTSRDGLRSPAVTQTGGDYQFLPETVEANARQMFDGATVDSTARSRTNDRGGYYYMTARYLDQATCIYAWQILRQRTSVSLPENVDTVALQFRYCENTDDTERLVDYFDEIQLTL